MGNYLKSYTRSLKKAKVAYNFHAVTKGKIQMPYIREEYLFVTINEEFYRIISVSLTKTKADDSSVVLNFAGWFHKRGR